MKKPVKKVVKTSNTPRKSVWKGPMVPPKPEGERIKQATEAPVIPMPWSDSKESICLPVADPDTLQKTVWGAHLYHAMEQGIEVSSAWKARMDALGKNDKAMFAAGRISAFLDAQKAIKGDLAWLE